MAVLFSNPILPGVAGRQWWCEVRVSQVCHELIEFDFGCNPIIKVDLFEVVLNCDSMDDPCELRG